MMEMEARVVGLEARVAQLEARVAVAETNIDNVKEKIDKIDSNTTWLLRIVVGAIVAAVLGLILKTGGVV